MGEQSVGRQTCSTWTLGNDLLALWHVGVQVATRITINGRAGTASGGKPETKGFPLVQDKPSTARSMHPQQALVFQDSTPPTTDDLHAQEKRDVLASLARGRPDCA